MPNVRRALIIGINTYQHGANLSTCVADAHAMGQLLEEHEDGRPNYDCRILLDQTEKGAPITMAGLREACSQLFGSLRLDLFWRLSLCARFSEKHLGCANAGDNAKDKQLECT